MGGIRGGDAKMGWPRRNITVRNIDDAIGGGRRHRLPAILRPSFTLGGTGGGAWRDIKEWDALDPPARLKLVRWLRSVLVERGVVGWKRMNSR